MGGNAATSSVTAGAFYWLLLLGAPIDYVARKKWQGRARDVRFTVAGVQDDNTRRASDSRGLCLKQ